MAFTAPPLTSWQLRLGRPARQRASKHDDRPGTDDQLITRDV
jgi:hypothetical protein